MCFSRLSHPEWSVLAEYQCPLTPLPPDLDSVKPSPHECKVADLVSRQILVRTWQLPMDPAACPREFYRCRRAQINGAHTSKWRSNPPRLQQKPNLNLRIWAL